jgi:hypothetical protein
MMLRHFVNYAIKFEQAYASGNWKLVEPCFTADAAYVVSGADALAGSYEGRDAVLAYFAASTNGFDKRFDSREVTVIDGPRERDDHVWLRWLGTYRVQDAPDLLMEGESRAWFDGARIRRLEDWIPPEFAATTAAYMQAHGAKLRAD